jgi:hypothetical protein
MSDDASGWMWLLIDVGFVVVLAAAIAYGTIEWRKRRSARANQVRDQATSDLYHRPGNQ